MRKRTGLSVIALSSCSIARPDSGEMWESTIITSSLFTMTAELEPTFIDPVPVALYTPGTISVNLYAACGGAGCAWNTRAPERKPANTSAILMRVMSSEYACWSRSRAIALARFTD